MSEPKNDGWVMEEPGWWLHPELGGLCLETDGHWHHYYGTDAAPVARYKTLSEARTNAKHNISTFPTT